MDHSIKTKQRFSKDQILKFLNQGNELHLRKVGSKFWSTLDFREKMVTWNIYSSSLIHFDSSGNRKKHPNWINFIFQKMTVSPVKTKVDRSLWTQLIKSHLLIGWNNLCDISYVAIWLATSAIKREFYDLFMYQRRAS